MLSPAGDILYVLGPADAGGLCAYHVASGALTHSYTEGRHYAGLHQLPSGTLLAVGPEKPRLAFFSRPANRWYRRHQPARLGRVLSPRKPHQDPSLWRNATDVRI